MAIQCSSRMTGRIGLAAAAAALALLGGCIVAPVGTYPATTYDGVYYTPGYYYDSAPYYYGPPLSFSLYGWTGGGHGHNNWRGRPSSRPSWGRPSGGARPGAGASGGRPGGSGRPSGRR